MVDKPTHMYTHSANEEGENATFPLLVDGIEEKGLYTEDVFEQAKLQCWKKYTSLF